LLRVCFLLRCRRPACNAEVRRPARRALERDALARDRCARLRVQQRPPWRRLPLDNVLLRSREPPDLCEPDAGAPLGRSWLAPGAERQPGPVQRLRRRLVWFDDLLRSRLGLGNEVRAERRTPAGRTLERIGVACDSDGAAWRIRRTRRRFMRARSGPIRL